MHAEGSEPPRLLSPCRSWQLTPKGAGNQANATIRMATLIYMYIYIYAHYICV